MPARIATVLLAFAMLCAGVHADSRELPREKTYTSKNRRFEFRVAPKQIESQLKYFQEKAEGKSDAGALAGIVDNVCRGTLFEKKNGKLVERWSIPLVNEVAPASALVANDGSYVVTFDNWHSVGYGDDVVVIYDSEGRLWRKFGLEEVLPEWHLADIPTSASSRRWGGEHRLDDENRLLLLKIANFARPGEIVDSGDALRGYSDMKISLESGKVVEWHPRPWTEFRVASGRDLGIPDGVPDGLPGGPKLVQIDGERCGPPPAGAQGQMVLDVGPALGDRATSSVNPPYPAMAKAARVTGRVIVQVLVSDFGDVLCSRAVGGHPLLRPAAERAVREWKFEPPESGSSSAGTLGSIVFDFRIVEVVPDGAVE
jgi:TonB family protein